ncbi:N-acetylaspartate synthetase-like [Clavelina lepadiformis]|uniref:N-acetylaspartate synthetase-like n=1 Tax=Clavelina lepadiformis TaxID=159417 RepID=UPI004041E446
MNMSIRFPSIREADFKEIEILIREGMLDQHRGVHKYAVLKSAKVQLAIVIPTLFISSFFQHRLFIAIVLYLGCHIAAYLHVRTLWEKVIKEEMAEFETWQRFNRLYCRRPSDKFWVAVDTTTSTIVGTIGVTLAENSSFFEVKRMSIAKTHRRRGLAQKLLEQVLHHCQKVKREEANVEKIILITEYSQLPAIKLYQRNGFKFTRIFTFSMMAGLTKAKLRQFVKPL